MSIIEQATKRLEELRRAGIEVDWTHPNPSVRIEPGMQGSQVAAELPAIAVGFGREPFAQGAVQPQPPARQLAHELPAAVPVRPTNNTQSKQINIDLVRLAGEGYLTPEDPRSALAEELRAVKRPIIEHALQARLTGKPNGNLILVTSSLAGEGKTYTAINLAMSIAMEVDHSVLLVDADVVRPSMLSRLGVQAELGLLDVLNKSSLDLSDVLLRTNIPKLSLLPAGSATAKSTELLASAAMERLLAEVAVRYSDRIVIFDGPPLLATSEAKVLASRMGQVLMVVEASKTHQSSVVEGFAKLESCETVWAVLNKAASENTTPGYGYSSSRES